jgi:Domain of unknown function (DUF1929)/Carboxypeptidase regulatory-like domain/Glyoxal oxidase N-terminus/IPT/TIG domain
MQKQWFASRRIAGILLALSLWFSLFIPALGVATVANAADPLAATGQWSPVIDWQIFGKHMVLLPNGKVLAWPTGQDAVVWDPATQTKIAVPATFGDLHCAAQTLLPDGRVIVIGGVIVSPHDGITVTAIFDPATNLWTNAQPMHYPRWYATSTTLPDGRVLVSSGDITGSMNATIPEIYDPATNTWTLLPASASKDLGLYPQMFVLPNGKVFKAGASAKTALLDITTSVWTNGPTNAFGSSGYAESSAMYAPGKIIRSGGGDPAITNTAIVDMNVANPVWKQTSPMNFPRRRHNMVILADGQVLAVGGTRSSDDLGDGITTGAVYEGEIWNPATEQWTVVPRMTHDRMYHSAALLLPDGRVLTAGGENAGREKAEIYSPPYLFKGPRPVITAVPATVGYGADFSIGVTTDGSAISSVALIDLAAVTHAFDHNQRYVPLTFSQAGNTLSATAPSNANYAPPGYYMLVVTDSKGVPSVAKFVRIDSAANLTPGKLTGKVTDSATGNPIQGAAVSYAGGSTTTAANGTYTLANVMPGEVLVTVSKTGYATISRTQAVAGGTTATLNVALAPPGTITGKVISSVDDAGIAGAIVTYSGGTIATNASGDFTITDLPSGSQTLVAAANGYNSSPDQVVNVPANGTATTTITLTPKPTYLAGEVRDSVTDETVAGVTISAGGISVTTDAFGRYQLFVPPGTYNVSASKAGYTTAVNMGAIVTFGTYTAIDFKLDSTNPPVMLDPLADTYTSSTAPTQNFGASMDVRSVTGTGTNLKSDAFFQFNITGLTRPTQSAKLRLYVTNASNQGVALYSVANSYKDTATPWLELGLNYSNAPAISGTPLSSVGMAAINTWVEFDVTAAISGNGVYSFGLRAPSTNDVRYSSKEGPQSNRPQLVIQQVAPATLTAIAPTKGITGEEVTITGSGFTGVTSVAFGGVPAVTFIVDSETQIRALVPAGAVNGQITITTNRGSVTSLATFEVIAAPLVTAFTPSIGTPGTQVTITGSGFTGATNVTFGDFAASSFTIDSDTRIRAIVPPDAVSSPITVVTSNGTATSAASFVVSPVAAPLHWVYLPLQVGGGGASVSSALTNTTAIYKAFGSDWRAAGNLRSLICALGLQ